MIHPTAIVHPSARIEQGVSIGPYAVIGEGVTVGAGTSIGSHSVVEFAAIGKNCRISPHAVVGTPPQDFKYNNEPTKLIMGDNCVVRECVTLNRGTLADGGDGATVIGNDCYFMAYSHVAHDCMVGNGAVLVNCAALAGHVTLGDYVMIGGLSAVHQFVRVGTLVMVGGATGVERDAPPFSMIEGNRGKLMGLNMVGLRRRGFNRAQVSAIHKAYETLFHSGRPLADALVLLEQGNPGPELHSLIDFLKAPSKRGITRPEKTAQAAEAVVS